VLKLNIGPPLRQQLLGSKVMLVTSEHTDLSLDSSIIRVENCRFATCQKLLFHHPSNTIKNVGIQNQHI